MKHTFAICAYKASPYLEACIRSLLAQTVPSDIILCTSTPNDYIYQVADKYQIDVYVNEAGGNISADWNFAYRDKDVGSAFWQSCNLSKLCLQ